MPAALPPPPTRADEGSFAWTAWYNQLYTLLSTAGSVSWALIDKAGSSIADLANHTHGALSSVLGTGSHHISATEQARVTATMVITSLAANPTTTDIPSGNWAIYKNTTSGQVRLWANDSGTMKSTLLS